MRAPTSAARLWFVTVALALVAGGALAIHLDRPAFFDNEGRYAEVAREMLVRGDYVTPEVDGTLFLNKPPLTYWLTAAAFHLVGVNEWARIVPLLASLITLLAACHLAIQLFGPASATIAGLLLVTTSGWVLEARTLRPDAVLTAAITVALLCWWRAEHDEKRRTGALLGMYVALGVGIMAKGLVGVIIPALPIAAVTLSTHGWRGVGRMRPLLGLLVISALVLPWHVLVSLRHPGFAWDYIINQHLLFFFDQKPTRDSEGDTLGFFWMALLLRSSPWVLLVPLTAGDAWRGWRPAAAPSERATLFLWTWVVGLMAFFSLAPSRLEHYVIPAIPAVALLGARAWNRLRAGEVSWATWYALAAGGGVLVAGGLCLAGAAERLFRDEYWVFQAPDLLASARPAGLSLSIVGGAALVGAMRHRADVLLGGIACGMTLLLAVVLHAHVAAEPLFTWKPTADALVAAITPDTEVIFEAPIEYQQVGGLAFYARRQITLLAPPGFVAPDYLVGQVEHMFLDRSVLPERWRSGKPVAFVSDPQQRRDTPQGLVPEPFRVVTHQGDRWVLVNF